MLVETIVTGLLQTNTYLIVNESGEDAVLIDPAADFDDLIAEIEEKSINLKAILITHGHFDHIGIVDEIKHHFNVPVYAHRAEAEMMMNGSENLSKHFFGEDIIAHVDYFIDDGEHLDFGNGLSFDCITVSGHTNNSICYYNKEYNFIVTGDTLMAGSIGRTDFNCVSPSVLIHNIKERLLVLPENTVVYSGHGHKTTIKAEKSSNPYF